MISIHWPGRPSLQIEIKNSEVVVFRGEFSFFFFPFGVNSRRERIRSGAAVY